MKNEYKAVDPYRLRELRRKERANKTRRRATSKALNVKQK